MRERHYTCIYLLFVCILACFLNVGRAWGQTDSASLSGSLVDQRANAIFSAKLFITNLASGARREAQTNQRGIFLFPALEPGKYRLRVVAEGFAVYEIDNIELHVADRKSLPIVLKVAAARDVVMVKAPWTGGEVTGGGISTVVDKEFLDQTALNGRSFQSLLLMTPGAVMSDADGGISVNGMRSDADYFTLDGVSVNSGVNASTVTNGVSADPRSLIGSTPSLNTYGGTQGIIGVDSLEEFTLQSSAMSAESGREMGAQVKMVSRSGSNEWHGSAYDYLRNDALDAKQTYYNRKSVKTKVRQNNFGGTFGGPILKNKTFFFVSYEGQRDVLPNATSVYMVPSDAYRTGDTSILNAWLDPTLLEEAPTPATSTSRMGSELKGILSLYPKPNMSCNNYEGMVSWSGASDTSDTTECGLTGYIDSTVPAGLGLWQGSRPNLSDTDNWSVKINHNISDKLVSFARMTHSNSTGSGQDQVDAIINDSTHNRPEGITLGLDWMLTPTLSNSLRLNTTQTTGSSAYTIGSAHDGGTSLSEPNSLLDPLVSEFTQVSMNLSAVTYIPTHFGHTAAILNRQWNFVDDVSWMHGRHSLRLGVDWRGLYPKLPSSNNADIYLSENSVADLYSNTYQYLDLSVSKAATLVIKNYSAYGSDHFAVNSRLSLDFGLRWDINPAPQGRHPGDLRYVMGWNGMPYSSDSLSLAPAGTSFYDTQWRTFAPRAGFAYAFPHKRMGHETVLRGGWGMFYDFAGEAAASNNSYYPLRQDNIVDESTAYPISDLSSQIQSGMPDVNNANAPYPSGSMFLGRIDGFSGMPRSQQWNVSLQQSLGQSQSLTVSYVGNAARNMLRRVAYAPGDFTNTNFPSASVIVVRNDPGWADSSDYHGLQVQFQRRMSKGLEVLSNYTWAHAIDTNSSETQAVEFYETPAINRGNSDFDRRHIINVALTYKPERIAFSSLDNLAGKGLRSVVNGWLINTNFKAQTSTPLTVTVYRSMYPVTPNSRTVRVDRVSGKPLWVPSSTALGGRILNADAFSVPSSCMQSDPTLCREGNTPRNSIPGFSSWQEDVSLDRTFPLHDAFKLHFRADFFNVMNHPNWASPDTSLGTVSGTKSPTLFPNSSFGYSTGMSNTSTAYNAISGYSSGLNKLYQSGGPRSIQLAMKMTF